MYCGVPCGYALCNSVGCFPVPPGTCVTGYSGVYIVEQRELFPRPVRGMCYGVPCGYTLWNNMSCSPAPSGA